MHPGLFRWSAHPSPPNCSQNPRKFSKNENLTAFEMRQQHLPFHPSFVPTYLKHTPALCAVNGALSIHQYCVQYMEQAVHRRAMPYLPWQYTQTPFSLTSPPFPGSHNPLMSSHENTWPLPAWEPYIDFRSAQNSAVTGTLQKKFLSNQEYFSIFEMASIWDPKSY